MSVKSGCNFFRYLSKESENWNCMKNSGGSCWWRKLLDSVTPQFEEAENFLLSQTVFHSSESLWRRFRDDGMSSSLPNDALFSLTWCLFPSTETSSTNRLNYLFQNDVKTYEKKNVSIKIYRKNFFNCFSIKEKGKHSVSWSTFIRTT